MPTPSLALGRALVGRYSIQRLLGIGPTTEVYLADDQTLNRRVVIKVLLPELAQDPQRRRLFRERIVSLAALTHPSLAQVYDGGQESGTIFMVSEYLTGGSLTTLLEERGTLEIEEVALIGLDAASALAYAHANGLVHGRLSPDYLLFDANARVRVNDVGLAELNGLPVSLLSLRDARFVSPEQATGAPSDAHADVYALGLILFECATGVVPFTGATVNDTLAARVGAPLPVRDDLGSLDMVLAQATLSDPRLRLDATQLANRISGLTNSVEPPVALEEPWVPREGGRHAARVVAPPVRTTIGFQAPSPAAVAGSDPTQSFRAASRDPYRSGDVFAPRGRFDPEASAPLAPGARPTPARSGTRVAVILVALVVVLGAVGAAAAYKLGVFKKSHPVPSLIGRTTAQALSAIASDGFSLTVGSHVASATVPAQQIVSQTPVAGTVEKSGHNIVVTISSGPNTTTLPVTILGSTCAVATATLKAIGITALCPVSDEYFSSTVPKGDVVEVVYQKERNPTSVPVNATVLLVVSKGVQSVATTTTTAAATTTTTKPASGGGTATTTTSTSTTTTTLAGEGLRAVPNVVGMTPSEVDAAMHSAALYYTTTGPGAGTNPPQWKTVVSESPAAGTSVKWHSTVLLHVSE